MLFFKHLEDDEVLKNFYKFPSPPVSAMKKRMKQIEKLKEQMGDKYILAKPVERKNG